MLIKPTDPALSILFEDNHLLVIDKPPGLATMGAEDDRTTAHRMACEYIRDRYQKPGKVFLGVVHRLDKPTSGVLLFARTSKAASRLASQFAATSGATTSRKQYLALLQGRIDSPTTWRDEIFKDDAGKRMRVGRPGKMAVTHVQPTQVQDDWTLAEMILETGRKHQIRVQAAHHGHAICGDFKYAGAPPGSRLMLHAQHLTIQHPTLKTEMTFTAAVPNQFSTVIRTTMLTSNQS